MPNLDPTSEQNLYRLIDAQNNAFEQSKTSANPQLAERVSQIYRENPWFTAEQTLALAKANASPQAVEIASRAQGQVLAERLKPNPPQEGNWVERNITSKIRMGTRWGLAAAQFPMQFVQGGLAQIPKPGDTLFAPGWFTSTDLGAAVQNPDLQGSGWFMGDNVIDPATGERVNLIQEIAGEKARAYRGAVNGHAWTVGRQSASLIFRPGTLPYHYASGIVDALLTLEADPLSAVATVAGYVRSTRAAIPAIKSVEEAELIQSALRSGLRSQAGLQAAEEVSASGSKFFNFWNTDSRASRLVDALASPEENNAYAIFEGRFKRKIDLASANRLAKATTREQVLEVIADLSRRIDTTGGAMFPEDIRRIVTQRSPLSAGFRNGRIFMEKPGMVMVFGNEIDNAEAVSNLGRYLDNIEPGFTATEDGRKLMSRVMRAVEKPYSYNEAVIDDAYNATVKKLLERNGATDDQIKLLFDRIKDFGEEMKAYNIDAMGVGSDGGWLQSGIRSGYIDESRLITEEGLSPDQIAQLRLHGPGTFVEMQNRMKVLPDPQQIRRILNNPFWIHKKTGDLRAPLLAVEHIHGTWKQVVMTAFGFLHRNLIESQTRMAVLGKDGFFNHPLRYIQYVMGKRAAGTITGRSLEEVVAQLSRDANAPNVADGVVALWDDAIRSGVEDLSSAYRNSMRTQGWDIANRQFKPDMWKQGLIDEIGQLAPDPVANMLAQGRNSDEVIDWLRNTPTGRDYLVRLEQYLKSGRRYVTPAGKTVRVPATEVTDQVIRDWIEQENLARLNLKTGGSDDLRFAVAHRAIPKGPVEQVDLNDIQQVVGGGDVKKGSRVLYNALDENGRLAVQEGVVVDDPTNVGQMLGPAGFEDLNFPAAGQIGTAPIRQLSSYDVVDTVEGRVELGRLIDSEIGRLGGEAFPQHVKVALRPGMIGYPVKDRTILQKYTIDLMFGPNGLANKTSRTFEKSPAFRQFYYEHVVKNVDGLSRADAEQLVANIRNYARAYGKRGISPEKYVGSAENWDALLNAAERNTETGVGTIKQLDEYAKIRALDEVKTALFDASEKSNFQEAMRLIWPFGNAWQRVVTDFGRMAIEDPRRIRRAQIILNGLGRADANGDGRGMFYADPTTGDLRFIVPFSGELAYLMTGMNAPLSGRVSSLSQGLQWSPGLGPIWQIAASKIIPDTPSLRDFKSFLLPYGQKGPGAESFAPTWILKAKSALFDNPNDLQSLYGQTYVDTVRALSMSGDYGPDEQSKARLDQDAKQKARVLLIMRALGQFVGPVSPSNEYMVKNAENQDVLASAMQQEYFRLQNENYDTAVSRFIEMFGEDAFMYLSPKTEAQVGGLAPTEAFADWEYEHRGFLEKYPLMGGFFAPGGDKFSFEVWDGQLRDRKTARLTASEIWDRGQRVMGSAIYRYYRNQVGAYPTDAQRLWLRTVRQQINARYPKFPVVPVFTVNEDLQKIEELKRAVQDPQIQGEDVGRAIATYLTYRDQAIGQWVAQGGSEIGFSDAKGSEQLRNWLVSIGMALGEQVPEFQRVWDRELSNEVDR